MLTLWRWRVEVRGTVVFHEGEEDGRERMMGKEEKNI